jgi:hypothetical protein
MWTAVLLGGAYITAAEPIRLHPENPHYFLWRGKPTVLITSAEHYGAVLNLDFDYIKYLDTLAADGLNLTRTFTGGAYVEPQGAFNIARNTLAPAAGRYITPWARSDQPGYAGGGNKFDLTRWNEAYFDRLCDFVAHASRRGVVVEVNLFCPMYEEKQWRLSPFNVTNNVNGLGDVGRLDIYTLDQHGGLLAVEERMTRKFVAELRDFDNIYYEITNEPYTRGVPREWEHHMVDVIVDAQKGHPNKKLISLNIANNAAKVEKPHPAVSIFIFDYATPPRAVTINYGLNKVIGDNETGFRGTGDAAYRTEAWDFLIAGGGLYNNLDYSFAVGYEDGTFQYPSTQPGGGNPGFRRQMSVLREFINGFDFVAMKPDNAVITGGIPAGGTARALVQPGQAYAIYLRHTAATGPFSVRWTGYVVPKYSEQYTFHTFSNDGVRLWVDGRQLIDKWVDQSETEHTGRIRLEPDRKYAIKLEYFYNGGQGAAKLWWSSKGQSKQPIASSQLRLPDDSGRGLRGVYHRGNNFQQVWATREDAQVNFSWGTEPPFSDARSVRVVPLQVELPRGSYVARWVDTLTGQVVRTESFQHQRGSKSLAVPQFRDDIALRINSE